VAESSTNKDTIYIDVDDEITTIIDKVRSSPKKIIALVLPKRATVFQSIVNLKLLKRGADSSKKNLVLITTEAGLLPLAGTVGLYVAKNLQSKPEIPEVATADVVDDDVVEEADDTAYTADNAGDQPVGDLAAKAGGAAAAAGGIETLALDNEDDEEAAEEAAKPAGTIAPAVKKDNKLKVPNFNKFRAFIALGILAIILLVGGLIYALKVMPKATINIKTDASTVNSALDITLDTAAKSIDKATLTIPAQAAEQQKTQSQQVPATGTKNNGDKATGTVKLTACIAGFTYPDDVSSGTGVSSGGMTYITQSNASFSPVGPDSAHSCFKYVSNSVDIKAQAGGAKYNVSSVPFIVAGRSEVTGSGSASGGTDDIIKVVQQSDIDGAKQKIATVAADPIKQQLAKKLQQDGLYALTATFDAGEPSVTTSSQVGDQTDNVTVTATYTYTMFGTEKSNLDTLLNDDIKGQVDTSKETILDNGLKDAQFRLLDKSATVRKVNLQTTGTVGPDLDLTALKKQAAGHKSGEVVPMIKNLPGVTDVEVKLGPFWVTRVPSNPDKITMVVEKPTPKK
jgi:hypothetical protein